MHGRECAGGRTAPDAISAFPLVLVALAACLAGASPAAGAPSAAMSWGANGYGQLGVGAQRLPGPQGGEFTSSGQPLEISGLTEVRSVAAGAGLMLAVLEGGGVEAWGENEDGQLGTGTSTGPEVCEQSGMELEPCSLKPLAVHGLGGVRAVAAGGAHGLALLEDGTVEAWGSNQQGQLGQGSIEGPEVCETRFFQGVHGCSTRPIPVPGLHNVKAIAAGQADSFALLENGTVMAWGGDEAGELGVEDQFETSCGAPARCASRRRPS